MTNLSYGAASIHRNRDTTTVTYRELSAWAQKSGRCACGKRRTRSQTFTQTVSPFNRDPETDAPRTIRQVQAALNVERDQWVPDFTCTTHEYMAIKANIIGSSENWETVYTLGSRRPSRRSADWQGTDLADGTDDYLVALLDGDRMISLTGAGGVALDWTSESLASLAAACGFTTSA